VAGLRLRAGAAHGNRPEPRWRREAQRRGSRAAKISSATTSVAPRPGSGGWVTNPRN